MYFSGFLIWGHGIPYLNQIAEEIRKSSFTILVIKYQSVTNLDKFVKQVYSLDHAPAKHLFDKTRYLKNIGSEVFYILVKNENPIFQNYGKGEFAVTSCKRVVDLKWAIRAKYNPRLPNLKAQPHANLPPGVSHQHVIHATDTMLEVEHLNKLMKLVSPSNYLPKTILDPKTNVIYCYPFHLKVSRTSVKTTRLTDLRIHVENQWLPINKTPHYQYLTGNHDPYVHYIKRHLGKTLIEDHLPEAFDHLIEWFTSEIYNREGSPYLIIVKGNQVQDGGHRLSILCKEGIETIKVLSC